jgi:hypothetical protein
MGWAGWDLAGQQAVWTPQMHEIFGRDRSEGPIALEDIATVAVAQDLPVLAAQAWQ